MTIVNLRYDKNSATKYFGNVSIGYLSNDILESQVLGQQFNQTDTVTLISLISH